MRQTCQSPFSQLRAIMYYSAQLDSDARVFPIINATSGVALTLSAQTFPRIARTLLKRCAYIQIRRWAPVRPAVPIDLARRPLRAPIFDVRCEGNALRDFAISVHCPSCRLACRYILGRSDLYYSMNYRRSTNT